MSALVEIRRRLPRLPLAGGRRRGAAGADADRRGGGALRRARAERLGQVDAAADRRRLRPRLGRLRPGRRRRRRRARCAGGAARFRSRSIGYADQHYWRALAGELTARELVGIQLGLAGVAAARRDARADELLERVGLGDRRDAHPARALRRRAAARRALRGAREQARAPDRGRADRRARRGDRARRARADRRARARVGRHRPRRQPRPRLGGAGRPRHPRPRRAHLATSASPARPATARSSSGAAAGCGSPRTCSARPGSTATRRPSFAAARSSSSRREQVFLKHKPSVPHDQAVSERRESKCFWNTKSDRRGARAHEALRRRDALRAGSTRPSRPGSSPS